MPLWLLRVWSFLRSIPAAAWAILGWVLAAALAYGAVAISIRQGRRARLSKRRFDALLEQTKKLERIRADHRSRVETAKAKRAKAQEPIDQRAEELADAAGDAEKVADALNESFKP